MKKTPNKSYCLIITILFCIALYAQEIDLKQHALNEFKKENYPKAISLLKQAASENPNDAEIYYYLGYFSHYIVYDTRPFVKKSDEWSNQEVIKNLEKAIALNPNYGDAYYFIGAEYSARAWEFLRNENIKQYQKEIVTGREKGGYPDWLIEIGRNILKSCELNAILFVGGDADFNATQYLQIVENYRKDVSVIPLALLERPWYVKIMKNGVPGVLVSVPFSWTENQILDMHAYKWKTINIGIPISKDYIEKYNIEPKDTIMNLKLKSNLSMGTRSMLSPGNAVLINIIETNQWQRPIYFSLFAGRIEELGKYYQLCGLTHKLLPIETKKYGVSLNIENIERVFLNKNNYKNIVDIKEHDMPRISYILNNYRIIIFQLAEYYYKLGNKEKGKGILEKINVYMPEIILPLPDWWEKETNKLQKKYKETKQPIK